VARYAGPPWDQFSAEITSADIAITATAARATPTTTWELHSSDTPGAANDPAGYTRTTFVPLSAVHTPGAPLVWLDPDPSRRRAILRFAGTSDFSGNGPMIGTYDDPAGAIFPLRSTRDLEIRHTSAVVVSNATLTTYPLVAMVEHFC